MKLLLTITVFFISSFTTSAQQTNYSPAAIKRIADLGRVWGMINYFHPAMGNGNINTMQLVVPNAAALAADPLAAGFTKAMNNMMAHLNDPYTRLLGAEQKDTAKLFTSAHTASVHRLASGYWYIALPTQAVTNSDVTAVPGILPAAWDSARGILLDLRNAVDIPFGDGDFIWDAWPLVEQKLAGKETLPAISERIAYHNGLVPQENGENNIYYSGWQTMSQATAKKQPAISAMVGSVYNKRVAFIINRHTSYDLLKRLLVLRAAGKCLLIYEGEGGYATGKTIQVPVADGQRLQLRVSDLVIGSNGGVPKADLVVPVINDFTEGGSFLRQCTQLLEEGPKPGAGNAQSLSLQYSIPRFEDTNRGYMVPVGERLLALYNHWNAIRYFYPYKKLLQKDWNDVLEEQVPVFLKAADSVQYNYALRGMISEIHDSHGFFSNTYGTTPVRYELGSWPALDVKFIGEKLYVVNIGADSLKGKNVQLWDEVTAIDGIAIPQKMAALRWYMATSNEATYKRDIAPILTGGKYNTTVTLTLKRGNTMVKETFTRSGRYIPKTSPLDFNTKYPVLKLLDSNTGYVNMGALTGVQVDSMFRLFSNTKAIIFDIRNYPKGTAWSIAPRLTKVKKQAVKFHYPFITYENILGGESDFVAESFFTVNPDTTKHTYKGKIIVLCNASTQSQAEYSIMMLQGATDVTVIGSQTAGADGNVTTLILPGNYRTSFSGLEILYPDGGQTQRSGIRVDIKSEPTLKGLQQGKDEVLERAVAFLRTGK